MLKNTSILEVIKGDIRKFQMLLPEQVDAVELLQVLSEMFAWTSNAIQNGMKAQVPQPTPSNSPNVDHVPAVDIQPAQKEG